LEDVFVSLTGSRPATEETNRSVKSK